MSSRSENDTLSASSKVLGAEASVSELPGVGNQVGNKLAKLGIRTIADLLMHFPRRYQDYSVVSPISKLTPGIVTIKGVVKRLSNHRTRNGRFLSRALIEDDSGSVQAIWFNKPYLSKMLPTDVPVYFSGDYRLSYNMLALQNPDFEPERDFQKDTARIIPVYPQTEGLNSKRLRTFIREVLDVAAELPSILPLPIEQSEQLQSFEESLRNIHFPDSSEALEAARLRLEFEELFPLLVATEQIKQATTQEQAPVIAFDEQLAKQFVANLPFALTDAQRKAAWQILQDLSKPQPMNRLLQGDVGSGKTVVAALGIAMTASAGYQIAIMAPTDILARQHHQTVSKLLAQQSVTVGLLLGSLKAKEKQAMQDEIKAGTISVVIGTQALIQKAVDFQKLGLVIVDEQHRFGVKQRQHLKQKAGYLPHLLTMSATPIPRSLALTVFGDLDISVMNELPPGRQPITTSLLREADRERLYSDIDQQIEAERQVYVVCPLIAESDTLGVKSVEAEHRKLQKSVFAHRRIGLLHGKLKPQEKEGIMTAFKDRQLDILCTTTVVEVGVDVPNATIMLIEGAERFGLAQLHQLRGRVGRGEHQSYCYLLASNDTSARERLQLLSRHQSGFELAEADLRLRGPGEIYGKRQHGLLDLRLTELTNTRLISRVKKAAQQFLKEADLLQYPRLAAAVSERIAVTRLD